MAEVKVCGQATKQATFTLTNLSRKKTIHLPLEIADSEAARTRGLMFRKKVVPILFMFPSESLYPIHSLFVPGKFDAVYLDSEGEVAEKFGAIPPNRLLISPKKNARYLLELPCGMAKKLKIKVGDRMAWEKISGDKKADLEKDGGKVLHKKIPWR